MEVVSVSQEHRLRLSYWGLSLLTGLSLTLFTFLGAPCLNTITIGVASLLASWHALNLAHRMRSYIGYMVLFGVTSGIWFVLLTQLGCLLYPALPYLCAGKSILKGALELVAYYLLFSLFVFLATLETGYVKQWRQHTD